MTAAVIEEGEAERTRSATSIQAVHIHEAYAIWHYAIAVWKSPMPRYRPDEPGNGCVIPRRFSPKRR